MKRAMVIGVMGAGEGAAPRDLESATRLGEYIARQGWLLLCGGRNAGVMKAVADGATRAGGVSLGVLPGETREDSPCTIPLPTGLGSARNNVNVLASDVVVAVAFNPGMGTLSEIALAVKAGRPVIVLSDKRDFNNLLTSFPQANCYITDDQDIAEFHLSQKVDLLLESCELLRISMS